MPWDAPAPARYSGRMTSEPPTLWDRTAADLLAAASSHQPTPGGGSVAALSGAFGAALVHMAAVISRNKARKAGAGAGDEHATGGAVPAGLETAMADLERLQLRLRALADEDVAVFRGFVSATKLPRGTAQEQAARAEALAAAGEVARATPLEVARCCVQALETARDVLPLTHAEVVSDVGAGAALLRGALDAALLTLDINLRRLSSDERARWEVRAGDLACRGHAGADAVLAETRAQIAADNG